MVPQPATLGSPSRLARSDRTWSWFCRRGLSRPSQPRQSFASVRGELLGPSRLTPHALVPHASSCSLRHARCRPVLTHSVSSRRLVADTALHVCGCALCIMCSEPFLLQDRTSPFQLSIAVEISIAQPDAGYQSNSACVCSSHAKTFTAPLAPRAPNMHPLSPATAPPTPSQSLLSASGARGPLQARRTAVVTS